MAAFDPKKHHRRSIRLQGYDYSQAGAYFLTIVTQGRECLFGEIVNGVMQLNQCGEIVCVEWEKSAEIRREVELGPYVVMPNHFHAVVVLVNHRDPIVGATGRSPLPESPIRPNGPKTKSIGALMAGFKSSVTKRINEMRNTPGLPVWQRNYYEHIIRNQQSMDRIVLYMETNPARWVEDRENLSG